MTLLKVAENRRPFRLSELGAASRILPPSQVDMAMLDSFRRGAGEDVNPGVLAKARQSVAALFSNWETAWPASFASWSNSSLRLMVNQHVDRDLRSGKDRINQSWMIVSDTTAWSRVSRRCGGPPTWTHGLRKS